MGEAEDGLLSAEWVDRVGPAGEGREWIRHLIVPLVSKTDGEGGWGLAACLLRPIGAGLGRGGALYPHLRDHLVALQRAGSPNDLQEFYASRPMLVWLNVDPARSDQVLGMIVLTRRSVSCWRSLALRGPQGTEAHHT